ncbi:MAG: ABC transporter substrate-binding protein [Candidatus Promineifilaceae bacterium]|nr:ABC transporter substrate-binding protein [Candidatus Promineifilaceae bacterium]
MFSRKSLSLLVALLLLLLAVAACNGDADLDEDAGLVDDEEAGIIDEDPGEIEDVVGGDSILERAFAGDYDGAEVEVFGAFVDEDANRFAESMAAFEEETGIDVQYEGSGDFETLIQVRVEGGNPPDIAAFPQPGPVATLAEAGHVVDPSTFLGEDFLAAHYDQGWLDDATLGGQTAGVWYRANVKSLVWYPADDFAEAGYEIPDTWDELIALSDQIVADGGTPWCIGIESSGATGWVATDWIEDIMLRTQPPEVYDQWVAGELDFDSPEVRNAIETMGEIWMNEDYVLGGTTGIQTTPFGDAPTPMFDDPPSCWLHRQASFIPAFFPDDVEIGEEVDFFYFPLIDPEFGEPVLTAGDIFVMFNDEPAVRAVMAYLSTGASTEQWVRAGGFVAPHKDAEVEWYTTDVDRRFFEILQNASVTRFDASDQMPGAVGSGAFWTQITNWVGGEDLDSVLPAIDAAWPES